MSYFFQMLLLQGALTCFAESKSMVMSWFVVICRAVCNMPYMRCLFILHLTSTIVIILQMLENTRRDPPVILSPFVFSEMLGLLGSNECHRRHRSPTAEIWNDAFDKPRGARPTHVQIQLSSAQKLLSFRPLWRVLVLVLVEKYDSNGLWTSLKTIYK